MVADVKFPSLEEAEVRKAGRVILGPLSLAMPHSSACTVVMGPVGAGKSTLLRLLFGLDRLTKGRIIRGEGTGGNTWRQSFIFQSPTLLRRKVWENVAYPLRIQGIDRKQSKIKACRWLDRIGLLEDFDRPAYTLSGGQQQKIALVRALISEPDLIYLDEPTTSLDDATTHDIETILHEVMATGTRLMLATHNSGQARRLASEGVFLIDGCLCEQASADDFFDNPQSEALATYLRGGLVV